MSVVLSGATALLGLGGLVLTVLAALAWRRSGRARIGFVALGFALFAAAGTATAYGLYQGTDPVVILRWQTLLVAAGLLIVYLAAVKQ